MAKLETGYAVFLRGFAKINPRDIDAHERVIRAVQKAKAGEPADLLAMLSVDDLKVQSVTRRARAAEAPALDIGGQR